MRTKNIIRIIVSLLLMLLLIVVYPINTFAASIATDSVPSQSYSYWVSASETVLVNQKAVFKYKNTISSISLGIKDFSTLADMTVDKNGRIYLVDRDTNELFLIDNDYKNAKTIDNFIYNGSSCEMKKIVGVYVSNSSEIFLCDSDGGKIVVCDDTGLVNRIIESPKNGLLPKDFVFKPIKVVLDSRGYMFVLSEGSYYGALLFNSQGDFIGFYGANKVAGSAMDVIQGVWDSITKTNEKRSNSSKKLPYSFTDICIDKSGFVYTSTGATTTKGEQTGVIRRLSPNGVNILKSDDVVFGEKTTGKTAIGGIISQNISGLCIDEQNYIYAYDRTIGNIYMYDEECNLITAFGGGMGKGNQNGTYIYPCSIKRNGDELFVCDSLSGVVTVYNFTDYGKQIAELQRKTLDGDYESTKTGWQQILKENKNCQLAYVGLANVAFSEEDYKASLNYAKLGEDKATYAKAFEKVRDDFLKANFTWIFCVTILVVSLLIVLLIIKSKKKIVLIKNKELKLALSVIIHPFDVFAEIKEKKKGSYVIGISFLVLFYLSEVTKNDFSGYLFTNSNTLAFNSLIVLFRTIGAVLLWTISNWLVAALFGGLGKIKDIFIVTTYSLLPMTLANFAYVILSRCLTESEGSFLSLFILISQLYFVAILAIGIMKTHDFSFSKFVGTSVLTVLGFLLIVFIGATVVILSQQFYAFFATLTYEIVLR